MFTPLPGQTVLGISPESVVAVIESINSPNISIPELGTEPTKAWLVGCMTPGGGAAIFCYLLFLDTNRPIIYISNPPEVSLDQYPLLESESISFVESMGFMLDNLNFRARSPGEQQLLIETLPFFRDQQPRMSGTLPSSAAGLVLPPDAIPPERLAVARFLASF
ncbi:MAG: hypothetical protein Q8O67_27310 [Deltaproteobacteria bacterium]|nr:hypothetical protein [Deltaproteobacteria bacterium]